MTNALSDSLFDRPFSSTVSFSFLLFFSFLIISSDIESFYFSDTSRRTRLFELDNKKKKGGKYRCVR